MTRWWWPWGVLVILGAYHGLNPGMGWSFLMSSAHGAGLMLVPILLSLPPSGANQDLGLVAYAAGLSPWEGLLAATLHTAALLAVMALVAVVVYERYGVAFLRRAWLNV